MLALAVVSGLAYVLADQGDASTSTSASESIARGKIVLGVLFLAIAARNWRNRPAPGTRSEMPKWMSGIDALAPAKAFGLGLLLAGVNPKNLMLSVAAGAGLAQLGLSTSDAVASLLVFVIVGSLTIAGPAAVDVMGGGRCAPAHGDSMRTSHGCSLCCRCMTAARNGAGLSIQR